MSALSVDGLLDPKWAAWLTEPTDKFKTNEAALTAQVGPDRAKKIGDLLQKESAERLKAYQEYQDEKRRAFQEAGATPDANFRAVQAAYLKVKHPALRQFLDKGEAKEAAIAAGSAIMGDGGQPEYGLSNLLKAKPQLESTVAQNRPGFEQYMAARHTYLKAAASRDDLAKQMGGDYEEAQAKITQLLQGAFQKLQAMRSTLPVDGLGGDAFSLPPAPEAPQKGLAPRLVAGVGQALAPTMEKVVEKFGGDPASVRGAIGLAYPRPSEPKRTWGFPTNLQAIIEDFARYGLVEGPLFMAGGAATKAAGLAPKVAAKVTAKVGKGFAGKAAGRAAEGAAILGGVSALSPASPTDPKERAKHVAASMAVGGLANPALGAVGDVAGAGLKKALISKPKGAKQLEPKVVDQAPETLISKSGPEPKALASPVTNSGIPVQQIKGEGPPPATRDVLVKMSNLFKKTVRIDKASYKLKAHGFYRPDNAEVVIGRANNIPTAAHELAHYAGDVHKVFGEVQGGKFVPNATIQAELANPLFGATTPQGASLKVKMAEEFAEVVKAYFVNPVLARQHAPKAVAAFEKAMGKHFVKGIGQIQDDIGRIAGADPEWRTSAAFLRGKGEELDFGAKRSLADKVLENVQNEVRPITDVFKRDVEAITGEKVHILDDPWYSVSKHLGHDARMESTFKYGIRTPAGQVIKDRVTGERMPMKWTVRPLADIAKKAKGNHDEALKSLIDRTQNYLADQAAITRYRITGNRTQTGAGAGFEDDIKLAAKNVLQWRRRALKGDAEAKAILEGARRYEAVAKASLENLAKSGRISWDTYFQINKKHDHYAAMQRVLEAAPGEVMDHGFFRKVGVNFGRSSAVLKTAKGSARPLGDLYANLYRNISRAEGEITRNEILQGMVRALNRNTRNLQQGRVVDLSSIGREVLEPTKTSTTVFFGGKPKHYEFAKEYRDALDGLDEIVKLGPAHQLSRILTRGVTLMPSYIIRNPIRDTIGRLVRTKAGHFKGGIVPRGIGASARRYSEEQIAEFKWTGGRGVNWHLRSPENYYKATRQAGEELLRRGNHRILNPMRAVERSEIQGRLAEYFTSKKFAMEKGMSEEQAMRYASGESAGLMDFALAGKMMKRIVRYAPFMNPGIQATYSIGKAMKDRPVQTGARTAIIALTSVFLRRMWNEAMGDEELYDELPGPVRHLFSNFSLGNGKWLSIPMDYEPGAAAMLLEGAWRAEKGHPDPWDGFAEGAVKTVMPLEVTSLFQGLGTYYSLKANMDLGFSGREIAYDKEKKPSKRRGIEDASRLGKVLDSTVGQVTKHMPGLVIDDPRQWDFALRDMLGTAGQMATQVSDIGREGKKPITPGATMGITRESPSKSQSVVRLMELAKREGIYQRKDVKKVRELQNRVYDLPYGSPARKRAILKASEEAQKLHDRLEKEFQAKK